MIRAIIFDCFGVLTITDRWHQFRLSLPSDQQSMASELNQRSCRGEITKGQFIASVADLTGKSPQVIAEILDNASDKNQELLTYIKTLKMNYKIGLLSNVESAWIVDSFLNEEERQLFDAFIFSFEVGMTKPDPRIFVLAAERLGVEPAECVMVDDIKHYCESAKAAGLRAIHYRDLYQFKSGLEHLLSQQ